MIWKHCLQENQHYIFWFVLNDPAIYLVYHKRFRCEVQKVKQAGSREKKCSEIMWQTDKIMKGGRKREIVGHFCITVN